MAEMKLPFTDLQDEKPVGYCACCGGEIYPGDAVFAGAKGMVHEECLLDFLLDDAGLDIIAEELGYPRATA